MEADPDGEGDGTYPEPRVIHIRYRSLFDANKVNLHRKETCNECVSLLAPDVYKRQVLSLFFRIKKLGKG